MKKIKKETLKSKTNIAVFEKIKKKDRKKEENSNIHLKKNQFWVILYKIENKLKYCIEWSFGTIDKTVSIVNGCFLAFPTKKMRDTFYKNFKDLIEQCKELL